MTGPDRTYTQTVDTQNEWGYYQWNYGMPDQELQDTGSNPEAVRALRALLDPFRVDLYVADGDDDGELFSVLTGYKEAL